MDTIVIIDYGNSNNEALLRKLRDADCYSLLLPSEVAHEKMKEIKDLKGIILSGGERGINQNNDLFDEDLLTYNVPILGISYGMEILGRYLGAKVSYVEDREYSNHVIRVGTYSPLFKNCNDELVVYIPHTFKLDNLRAEEIALSDSLGVVGFKKYNLYGLEFLPESPRCENGWEILNNFIDICSCHRDFTLDNFINQKIESIKKEVGNEKVLLGLSGGLDSAVCALLLKEAIGENLKCLFVETGLHRKMEHDHIVSRFKELGIEVTLVDEGELFVERLKGVIDPDKKREVISKTFVEVMNREAKKMGNIKFYGQGTLYTDIKESKWSNKNKVIKKSSNVLNDLIILEPLKELTKEEVKIVGKYLGLSDVFYKIQPFPFYGLALRIIGEVTLMKLEIIRETDRILHDEVKKAGIRKDLYQYFTVLTNIDSVGVTKDNKVYYHTIAIRAVTSMDGINAKFYHFDMDLLEKVSRRIVQEVKGVNRVVYDITSKPPSTIEYQ